MQTQQIENMIDLVWPDEQEQNHYLAANQSILNAITASNGVLQAREQWQCATDLKQFYDPLFPNYNANRIPNTALIAAEGPTDIGLKGREALGTVARFFDNTLFNKTFPIHHILALGHYGDKHCRGDFAPYFTVGEHSFARQNAKSSYQVISRLVNPSINQYELWVESEDGEKRQAFVTWLPVGDLQPLPLHSIAITTLWHVYCVTQQMPTIIHCAAGVGRTGAVLLALQLAKHYQSIFNHQPLEAAAEKLRGKLQEIRTVRPAFITTKKQLLSAVLCAAEIDHHLSQYKEQS